MYWSLFSLTTLKDIKIENGQDFTEMVGELLFMAYHLMGVIVLINMLIAMMSSSFQEIEVCTTSYLVSVLEIICLLNYDETVAVWLYDIGRYHKVETVVIPHSNRSEYGYKLLV